MTIDKKLAQCNQIYVLADFFTILADFLFLVSLFGRFGLATGFTGSSRDLASGCLALADDHDQISLTTDQVRYLLL